MPEPQALLSGTHMLAQPTGRSGFSTSSAFPSPVLVCVFWAPSLGSFASLPKHEGGMGLWSPSGCVLYARHSCGIGAVVLSR